MQRKPLPREYVPRVLTEADFLGDEGAEALLDGTCEVCHSLDRVEETRANEEQWRAILLAIIGRGAALPLSDVEPLVEWLARRRYEPDKLRGGMGGSVEGNETSGLHPSRVPFIAAGLDLHESGSEFV